jgi:hypothetical protein
MLGNGRLEAQCIDGTKRLCHIRGKMRKKARARARARVRTRSNRTARMPAHALTGGARFNRRRGGGGEAAAAASAAAAAAAAAAARRPAARRYGRLRQPLYASAAPV